MRKLSAQMNPFTAGDGCDKCFTEAVDDDCHSLVKTDSICDMVITKAISQKVLVISSILSLLLIAGSIYLHLKQKHHLGRMNVPDGRVKPTESGVENLSKTDAIYVPPLQSTPLNITAKKSSKFNKKADDYYEDIYDEDYNPNGVDYPNDAGSKTNSYEDKRIDETQTTHKSSTVPYTINNDYGTDIDIEFVSPISEKTHKNSTDSLGLTEDCFHCLCMTVNRCKPFKCAHIDPCGIYGISKYYWLDGGSPKASVENENDYGEENQTHIEYLRCVNNENCAMETVRNYIKRYQRDCNNDGIIDCRDHIALHILGPSGCFHKELSPIHKIRIKTCFK